MVEQQALSDTAERVDALLADCRETLYTLQGLTDELSGRLGQLGLSVPDAEPGANLPDAEPTVYVLCLGTFQVRVDATPLVMPSVGRPITILKILADRASHPTSREALIEVLWPEISPDVGANRLRVAVHGLRQLIGVEHDFVTYDRGSYHLAPTHLEIDAERFETLATIGAGHENRGHAEMARSVYREAAVLYRGDYFEDDPFEDWVLLRRQHLRDLYLNLLVKLASLAYEIGDDEACIRHCYEIVHQDDCSEDAYRLLMLMHFRRGNRARALRWYALCEQILERELGVPPSASTQQLRDEILAQTHVPGSLERFVHAIPP